MNNLNINVTNAANYLSRVIKQDIRVIVSTILAFTFMMMPQARATDREDNGELLKAAQRASRIAAQKHNNSKEGYVQQKASNVDYSGLWAGRFVLIRSNCTGFSPSFLFRHGVQLAGNQVFMQTSHDGGMSGRTRDNGRRLEAGTQYVAKGGTFVRAALAYGNYSGSSTGAGLAVEVTTSRGKCLAAYGATAIRQFGF